VISQDSREAGTRELTYAEALEMFQKGHDGYPHADNTNRMIGRAYFFPFLLRSMKPEWKLIAFDDFPHHAVVARTGAIPEALKLAVQVYESPDERVRIQAVYYRDSVKMALRSTAHQKALEERTTPHEIELSHFTNLMRCYNGRNVILWRLAAQMESLSEPVTGLLVDTLDKYLEQVVIQVNNFGRDNHVSVHRWDGEYPNYIVRLNGTTVEPLLYPRVEGVSNTIRKTLCPTVLPKIELANPATDPERDIVAFVRGIQP
jgi:hypothetical protein